MRARNEKARCEYEGNCDVSYSSHRDAGYSLMMAVEIEEEEAR